jgi:hypothetical protein
MAILRGSNQRFITGDHVLKLLGRTLHLVHDLLARHLDLKAVLLLRLRELAPSLTRLRRLLIDELVVKIVAPESVCGEVVLVQQIFLYPVEIISEISEVVCLEVVGLEVHRLVSGSAGHRRWLFVVSERIEYFLRRPWLLLHFFLTSGLWGRFSKGIEIEVSKLIGFIFSLSCSKISKL